MSEREKKVPKRRFKEFQNTDAWEQRKLLESVEKVIDFRGRTPKKLGMDWSDTGYLALSALNVKMGFIDSSVDAHYGDQVLYESWMSGNELHKGQVLFTTEAPMGNVAQVPDNTGYILSQRTIAFEVKKEIITENYLAVVLGSPKSFTDLTALCSGGTAKGVSQKSLSGFHISVPREVKEQEEIAKFFQNLDNFITLHQRKLEKMKTLKNAYLTEMFPAEGECKPKLRVAGFTADWEQRKLGELAEIKDSARISKELWIDNGIRYLRSSDLLNDNLNGELFISKETYEMYKSQTGAPEIDDVLFTSGGKVGVVYHKLDDMPVYVQGGAILYIRTSKSTKIDGSYISTYFSTPKMQKYMDAASVGGTIKHFTLAPAIQAPINFPNIEEQQKIGIFFLNIARLITLHQRKLEKLKNIKKAYLNEMFI